MPFDLLSASFALHSLITMGEPEQALLGTLVVVVMRARHLPSNHVSRWNKQSPYARLILAGAAPSTTGGSLTSGNISPDLPSSPTPKRARKNSDRRTAAPEPPGDGEVVLSTPVDRRGGQHPEWDCELRFPVYALSDDAAGMRARPLRVECWAKVSGLTRKPDELLGVGSVDVADAIRKGEMDVRIPLSRNDGQRGELSLEMTFFAHGPPPPAKDWSVISSWKASVVGSAWSRRIASYNNLPPTPTSSWAAGVAEVGLSTSTTVVANIASVVEWSWKKLYG